MRPVRVPETADVDAPGRVRWPVIAPRIHERSGTESIAAGIHHIESPHSDYRRIRIRYRCNDPIGIRRQWREIHGATLGRRPDYAIASGAPKRLVTFRIKLMGEVIVRPHMDLERLPVGFQRHRVVLPEIADPGCDATRSVVDVDPTWSLFAGFNGHAVLTEAVAVFLCSVVVLH